MSAAQLAWGSVMHARHMPIVHRFTYPVFTVCLPLSQWAKWGVPGLGVDRFNCLSIRTTDHGPRDGSCLLTWVRAQLAAAGITAADGEVVLQTLPRLFGYRFSPVSFWFCYDRSGGLRAVLCEVNNTFGEHHNYLVAHADQSPIMFADELAADKRFYVSPFFEVEGEYRFRFGANAEQGVACVNYWVDGQKRLSTYLKSRFEPLTGAAIVRAVCAMPLLTLGVIVRIHWQALKLWLRGVPLTTQTRKPLHVSIKDAS